MISRERNGDSARPHRPRARLSNFVVTVVGLDAVGRQVALQLAALGVQRLQLVDSRRVSSRTYVVEGFNADDIGSPRIHAAAQLCHQINPQLDIRIYVRRSLRSLQLGDAVIISAEPIRVSRYIRQLVEGSVGFVSVCNFDRSGARIDIARDGVSLKTIAHRIHQIDRPANSLTPMSLGISVASIAAGLVVAEVIRYALGIRNSRTIRFDLPSLKLRVE